MPFEVWDDFLWKGDMNNFAKLQWKNSTPRIGVSGKQSPAQPKQNEVKSAHLLNVYDVLNSYGVLDMCDCILSVP